MYTVRIKNGQSGYSEKYKHLIINYSTFPAFSWIKILLLTI